MLSKFDDYPIHQTPEPIAHPVSSDRNVYDRYWFNGYDRDAEFYFGVALGSYPNRGIMDCGFSIVRGGEQHAFHASRRAPQDPTETQVGPFRIEILEPMRSCRVLLAKNDTGIECDLTFIPRTACVEEGRQTLRRDGRVMMDATRFGQFGHWRGWIRYAGTQLDIDPARVFATKDRSWGIRPVGEPEPGGAPSRAMPQFFFLWSPIHWEDCCTYFGIFEDHTGYPWHQDGMIVPAYASPNDIPGVEEPRVQVMARVGHELRFRPGTRRVAHARLHLTTRQGETHELDLEPALCFQMKGIGYTHPQWGHGHWKGELAIGGESWKSADLDLQAFDNQHVQQVCRARWGKRVGIGVLEQISLGPHARYGFKSILDPAG
jgi:hypothetical protein